MKEKSLESVNRIRILPIVVIAVISLGLAVLFSWNRVSQDYSLQGEYRDITADEFTAGNVEFDTLTGKYTPTADDAWIMYQGYNDSFSGVMVKLKESVMNPTVVTVYYSKANDEILSESHTVIASIDAGHSSCFLSLPNYPVNIVRIDLDLDCTIDTIALCRTMPAVCNYYETDFGIAVAVRAVILFAILFLAYCSHRDRIRKYGYPIKGLFVNPGALGSEHKYEYDYLRTLAALCVIAEHSVCEAYTPNVSLGDPGYSTLRVILALSLCCNVLYVMLSGALLLAPREESLKDFYIKRMGKVLIPTVSYFLLYALMGYEKEAFANGIGDGVRSILKGLATGRSEYMPHMWLVYVIIGLYIFAPFLRIVVAKISEGQLFGLIVAGFIFNCLTTYFPIFGITFGIETPIAGWIGVFLLGYYMTTEHSKKRFGLFVILGIIGLVVTFLMIYFRYDLLYYTSNWTPNMWLIGAGVFAVFTRFKKIFGRKNIIIASISKYNFSIMLIHVLLLLKVVLPFGWSFEADHGHLTLCIVGMILGCFVLSYIVAFVYDNTAIAAANYLYDKFFKRNSESGK